MGTKYDVDATTGNIVTAGSVVASGGITSTSTTEGFQPPAMTTTQRDAIISPTTGLEVFNTTTTQLEFWNGSAWVAVGGGGGGTPGGANTDVQFNSSGSFAGSANLTFDGNNLSLVDNNSLIFGNSSNAKLFYDATNQEYSFQQDATQLQLTTKGSTLVISANGGAGTATYIPSMLFGTGGIAFSTTTSGANDLTVDNTGEVSLGSTGGHPSALFSIFSTTRGFLPPRMTTTQRNAISSPMDGLIVYDITLHELFEYQNGTWVAVGGGSGPSPISFTTLTADTTLSAVGYYILNPGSTITITLPDATLFSGQTIVLKNITIQGVHVNTQSGQTIDGTPSGTAQLDVYSAFGVTSDGSNWLMLDTSYVVQSLDTVGTMTAGGGIFQVSSSGGVNCGTLTAGGGFSVDGSGNITSAASLTVAGGAFEVDSGGDISTCVNISANGILATADNAFIVDASGNLTTSTSLATSGNITLGDNQSIIFGNSGNAFVGWVPSEASIVFQASNGGDTRLASNGEFNLSANFSGTGVPVLDLRSTSSGGDVIITSPNGTSFANGTNATPDASAMVDIQSTTKGFLPPRMTTVQRDAIASPATGLQIYNTDTNQDEFFNSSVWGAVATGNGKLLQTVIAVFSTGSSALTSPTYAPTSITANITPTSTTSTMIITCSGSVELDNGGMNTNAFFTIFENGTDIGPGSGNGVTQVLCTTATAATVGPLAAQAFSTHGGSLTPITYILEYQVNNSGTVFIPTNASQCSIVIQEIEL